MYSVSKYCVKCMHVYSRHVGVIHSMYVYYNCCIFIFKHTFGSCRDQINSCLHIEVRKKKVLRRQCALWCKP